MTKPATPRPPRQKAARFLLIRYGGQGDALFLTPVAAELKRRGWDVHVAINDNGFPLLQHLPFIDKLYQLRREPIMQQAPGIPGHPCDLIEWHGAWLPVEAVYPRFPGAGAEYGPWAVCNYRFVIESNSIHPWINRGQNSNNINTYDMHFSWAGIDPMSIPVEERRPRYIVSARERQAIGEVVKHLPRPLYLIQPGASSPARSYFKTRELYEKMIQNTHGSVIVWNGSAWEMNRMMFPLPMPPESSPMRMSAALVERADLVISADTCISHVAEALSVKHLTFYSTVPAWTRSRDYTHEITVDLCVPDSRGRDACKCGVIGRDCPRVEAEVWAGLDQRQRDLLHLLPIPQQQQLGIPVAQLDTGGRMPQEYFETSPNGLQAEHNAAVQIYEGLRQRPAYCIASLDLWPHVEAAMKETE